MNRDGSYSVIFQEMSDANDGRLTAAENIGVLTYNASGEEKYCSFIPVRHVYYYNINYSFYPESYPSILGDQNRLKSYVYVNAKDRNYIFVNNRKSNIDPLTKGQEILRVNPIVGSDLVSCDVTETDLLPQKKLVFENMTRPEDHNLGFPILSSYNPENNEFVTLKLEVRNEKERFKLVWMQL